ALQLRNREWSTTETHVREYCLIKAALICSDDCYQQFWSWLHLPTETECQNAWPALRDSCILQLDSILKQKPSQRSNTSIPLKLVFRQLSLHPIRIHKRGGYRASTKLYRTNKKEAYDQLTEKFVKVRR